MLLTNFHGHPSMLYFFQASNQQIQVLKSAPNSKSQETGDMFSKKSEHVHLGKL